MTDRAEPGDPLDLPRANTDRELWRERPGDYYADSIHVTEQGAIGVNVGGHVIVLPVRDWHRRAEMVEHLVTRATRLEETNVEVVQKYDEAEAALRDARQRETQEEAARREDLADLEIALQRAEKAEAALAAAAEREAEWKKYATHKLGCAVGKMVQAPGEWPDTSGWVSAGEPCNCGLDALLSPTPTEPPK